MNEDIIKQDREIIEKQIASSLERSLYQNDLIKAKINLEFYEEHIKKYGSTNIAQYCNLKNRYNKMKGFKEWK